jgi:hypothetical protein
VCGYFKSSIEIQKLLKKFQKSYGNYEIAKEVSIKLKESENF